MKALVRLCDDVAQFPPGHWYDSDTGQLQRYYRRPSREHDASLGVEVSPRELREAFERAVHRPLMSDVPYGVLPSGGLASSLFPTLAPRFPRRRDEEPAGSH